MRNFMGTLYRNAPEGVSGDGAVVDSGADAAAAAAQAALAAQGDARAAEPDPAAAPAAPTKKPWYLDRISGESARAR